MALDGYEFTRQGKPSHVLSAALRFCAILMVVGLSKDNMLKSMIGAGLVIFLSSGGGRDPRQHLGTLPVLRQTWVPRQL